MCGGGGRAEDICSGGAFQLLTQSSHSHRYRNNVAFTRGHAFLRVRELPKERRSTEVAAYKNWQPGAIGRPNRSKNLCWLGSRGPRAHALCPSLEWGLHEQARVHQASWHETSGGRISHSE